jgi:hypothetical protein
MYKEKYLKYKKKYLELKYGGAKVGVVRLDDSVCNMNEDTNELDCTLRY